jgi:catecholate siderophore receptor
MSDPHFVTAHKGSPRRVLWSAMGLALLPLAAQAADAGSTTDAAHPDEAQATRLPGVQVKGTAINATSPKLTAALLDTPRAITVIPQAVLQQTAATSLQDALRTVPGITFGAGEGGNPNGDRPFIRGFDSESSLFIDGVRSSGSQSREVFDIEQIEVTKGPSSAYSGRGAVGGSINLVTKAPRAKDFIGGSVALGTDNYRRATADWNQTIGDDVAFRLNVMDHASDIPGRNGPDNRRWGIAPAVTFGLKSATSATLAWYHLQSNDIPDSGIPYNNPFKAGSPYFDLNGDGSPIRVPRDTFYGLLERDFQKQQNDVGTIRVQHDFDNGWTLRNATVHSRSSNDYIWTLPDDSQGNFLWHPGMAEGGIWRRGNTRVSDTGNLTNQTDLSGEFQIGAIRHTLAAGMELGREQTHRDSYLLGTLDPLTGKPLPSETGDLVNGACSYGIGAASGYWCAPVINPNPHDPWNRAITRANAPITVTTQTRSAWVFDTLTLSERWLLNLGTRFDHFETRSASAAATFGNTSNFWNYQAGLVYKPTADSSLYASWGTSSTPPGLDACDGTAGLSSSNADLQPESSRNLEMGGKWDVLDQRLSLTAAVFRSEKNNARVALTGVRGGPVANVGKQRVDGIELGLSGNLSAQWQMFAGVTWLDSTLVKASPATPGDQGNQFPNTPRRSATLWTSYALTPALSIGGGAFFMDKVYGNTANSKWVPSYTRYDAMAAYTVNPHLTLQLNVQNLTNAYYFDKAYASHYVAVAPGRSVVLSANLKF